MIPLEFRGLGIHPESTWKGWDAVPIVRAAATLISVRVSCG